MVRRIEAFQKVVAVGYTFTAEWEYTGERLIYPARLSIEIPLMSNAVNSIDIVAPQISQIHQILFIALIYKALP